MIGPWENMSLNYNKEYNMSIREWLLKVFAFTASIPKSNMKRRNCPVCGSADSNFFANNAYLDYDRCSQCSLIYMNPSLSANTVNKGFEGDDDLLKEYFSIISQYKTAPPQQPDPFKDKRLKDIYAIKQSGKLLDVGCSVGDFLHEAEHFYEVEGVEINPYTAGIAEKHFKVHKQPLSELGLEASYDIVTLHQILYGVPDPLELLHDIHKILKNNGILYINTPNADSYAMQLYKGRVNHLYGYTTLNVFNKKSLNYASILSGFRLKMMRTEWLDIYLSDLCLFIDGSDEFIHKKNSQITNYEEQLRIEDDMLAKLNINLGDRGNYLVAVLEKA
jgi:SAM-dependent methyltransferase